MQVKSIPPATITGVVALLAPHCPEISPTSLVKALRSYEASPQATAEKFLTKHQAAQVLGVSHFTVTRWAREGTVPSVRIGNCWKFPLSKLQALGDTQEGDQ